jgi:hypothetical protein
MKYLNGWVLVSALGLIIGGGVTAGCGSSNSSGGSGGTGGSGATGGSAGAGTGGSAGTGTGGSAGTGTGGSAGTGTGGSAGAGTGGSAGAAGAGGAGCVNLTVKNYLAWCSVSVAGGTASINESQTVCVPPGTVNLSASARQGFDLSNAPWHDTDGDTGQGDPGTLTGSGQTATRSTTETVGSSADCVWVCCPTHGQSDCPTTDQCP